MNSERPRLLIADDDDVLSLGVGSLMRRRGIDVDTIRSIASESQVGAYDVVVLDPHIAPRERVDDFIEQLRAVNPEVQILAVSEFLDELENDTIEATALITKPAHVEQYATAIEARLKLKREAV